MPDRHVREREVAGLVAHRAARSRRPGSSSLAARSHCTPVGERARIEERHVDGRAVERERAVRREDRARQVVVGVPPCLRAVDDLTFDADAGFAATGRRRNLHADGSALPQAAAKLTRRARDVRMARGYTHVSPMRSVCHAVYNSCLKDNYAYLVIDGHLRCSRRSGRGRAVKAALERENVTLRAIWLTHHHSDHVGGVDGLAADGIEVVAHASDVSRSPRVTRLVEDGDTVELGRLRATIIHNPGTRSARSATCRGLRVHRRHAVRRRLRSHVRGHAGDDARVAAEARGAAAGDTRLLRSRVHRVNLRYRGRTPSPTMRRSRRARPRCEHRRRHRRSPTSSRPIRSCARAMSTSSQRDALRRIYFVRNIATERAASEYWLWCIMYSAPGALEFACGSIHAPVSATRYQVSPAGSVHASPRCGLRLYAT